MVENYFIDVFTYWSSSFIYEYVGNVLFRHCSRRYLWVSDVFYCYFLYFGVFYKLLFYLTMGICVIFILLINLAFGFLVPQIDMGAHVGGLIGGFIAAAIASLPYQKHSVTLHRMLGVISFLIIIIFLVRYGVTMHDVS